MSETDSVGESVGAERDKTGRAGGFAGALGALLMIAGLVTMGSLPDGDATAPQVYEFFLQETGEVARPAAMLAVGLLLTLVMFATMRTMMSARRGSSAAGGAMLALGQIGIGLQVVALTMIGVLTLRPEDADPGSSRAILDLSELLAGISGAALALALIAMALGIRRTPGLLPARFAEAALLAAVGVALWTVRLFSDAGAFAADSFLGSTLGWLLLIAWVLAVGVWLLAIRPRRAPVLPRSEPAAAESAPAPAAPVSTPTPAPRKQSREERAAERMPPRTAPPPRLPTPPSASPPQPRKPFVPPPYPENTPGKPLAPGGEEPKPTETDASPALKPATPPDEPATVPPEPESGSTSEPNPEPEPGPQPQPNEPHPEPAADLDEQQPDEKPSSRADDERLL